jgi:hypothetical protein
MLFPNKYYYYDKSYFDSIFLKMMLESALNDGIVTVVPKNGRSAYLNNMLGRNSQSQYNKLQVVIIPDTLFYKNTDFLFIEDIGRFSDREKHELLMISPLNGIILY